MEISQGKSLCSYLYLKLKCHVFILSFVFFFPTKTENRREEQVLLVGRDDTSGRGRLWGKGLER
jgi:hypothetical protein